MSQNCWNPAQYKLYEKERNQPFFDLLALIQPAEHMHAVDLGCGTGKLTCTLHHHIIADSTLGIDSSSQMLQEASQWQEPGITFALNDIANYEPKECFDLIFSNACLQWLPDHTNLFARLCSWLSPSGQMAIQMPANYDFPSHTIAAELAGEFGAFPLTPNILSAEEYSQLLFALGFKQQLVRLQIYPLTLPSVEALIDWVKGSLLTYYQSQLSPEKFQEFVLAYRERLLKHFGNTTPLFVPFKRIFLYSRGTCTIK